MSAPSNEHLPAFLTHKLEYLAPKRQYPNNQPHQQPIDPKELELKKGGYIEPPCEPSMLQQQQVAHVDFYNEINDNKKKTWDRVIKVLKYNPFVPIGCLVTIGVLMNGIYALKTKDRAKSQRMMRYRVAAQGSTLIALCIGTMIANHLANTPD